MSDFWDGLKDLGIIKDNIDDSSSRIRLQKVISQAGLGSRRHAEELIVAGRVMVNGEVACLGDRADLDCDTVMIDGVPIMVNSSRVYYLIHKPRGVVSTVRDTHERPVVIDLVPSTPPVYPVGRLDSDSEGLLILTNDGEFTNRLTHPRYKIEKEYLVVLDRPVRREHVVSLRKGVELEDGITLPAQVNDLGNGALRIAIREGRNRQIRRMLAVLGYDVERLIRTRIGPLSDSKLIPGDFRKLEEIELRSLWAAALESD